MATPCSKSIYKWIRILHRDIGFFVVGLTVIYSVSGILLTFRDTGFLKHEVQNEITLKSGLSENQLMSALKLKRMKIEGVSESEIRFTNGTYNLETGVAIYITQESSQIVNKLNGLHKVASQDSRHWLTLLYAISLLLLALSSFWMYKPGAKHFKRGVVLAVVGGVISMVLVIM